MIALTDLRTTDECSLTEVESVNGGWFCLPSYGGGSAYASSYSYSYSYGGGYAPAPAPAPVYHPAPAPTYNFGGFGCW